ncbi:MAG: hypothetical protein IBX63_11320 [Coriobacteriia bacterium]|nr:hypothetical protein [Coriobacteriia bacterium]
MSGADTRAAKEYRHLSALLEREDSDLPDEERLNLARRLTALAPKQADSWWSVATQIDWMLRDAAGEDLREDPLVDELILAWDRVTELDPTDAAAPYNKSRILRSVGRLREAYDALMLAGKTEQAHPNREIEWPAVFHYEDAAELALQLGDNELALSAAQAALAAGASDPSAAALLNRLRDEASRRPT